ncbi:pectin lyase fold/virulence factor, partial [Zopfochytrium polystomum]
AACLLFPILATSYTLAAPAYAAQCVIDSYSAAASCAKSSNALIKGPFTVPAETSFDLSGHPDGASVTVTGTITRAKSSTLDKTHYLFLLEGADMTFDGAGATFDGNGQRYWDGQGADGGVKKPKMFRVTTTGKSVVKGITIKNSTIHCFSIGGSGTTFDSITVDNSLGDSKGGHNTDAFDVSASSITIRNSYVHNQDDCLVVNTGRDITFTSNTCIGGHGISIGSIKTGKTVDGVHVSNCTITDSGVRIK